MARHNVSHCEKTDCHVAAFGRLLAMTQKTTFRTKIGAECKKALSLRGPNGAVAIRIPCIRRNCLPIGATNPRSQRTDKLKFER